MVKLTGINNKMLRNAPKFYEVAKRIVEITEGCILVAHNASFDYRVLKNEFNNLGYDFNRNTLCTVSLSKHLIPDAPSHSLGKLCRHLGIPVSDRHRANGDAMATVKLFKLLLEKDLDKEIIQKTIKFHDKKEQKQLLQKILDRIPEKHGLFYVHSPEGNIIYIGRGTNIKQEVNKLFLKSTKKNNKIIDRLFDITYDETGNPLLTRLKYHLELARLKPKYNTIRKRKNGFKSFNHDNMVLIDKGRIPEENMAILIEKNNVVGYTFTNLAHQENSLDILKSMITPIEENQLANIIVKNYLLYNKVGKIVRLQEENNL